MPASVRRYQPARGAIAAGWCCLAIVLSAVASPAAGARPFHTVLQDDDLSLFSPRSLPQYMNQLRWLGVDELRISAEWKIEAPSPDSAHPPVGFRADAPNSYSSPGIRLLDAAVRAADAVGLQVIVDPAFSAPRWATSDASERPSGGWYNTNIDVRQAAAWEQMLARRYSGGFTPAGEGTSLPRVATFTLWNEPNERGYLKPQWMGGVAASADWYRRLVDMAYPAIKAASPSATVLIGNTSDSGVDAPAGSFGVAPLRFIERLACVDAKLNPVRDGPCAHFQTVPGDGYAHHPYERRALPWVPSGPGQDGWAQMGDVLQLQTLLNALVARHRLAPGAENLWLTEQGYASNAELGDMPWSEDQQAQLNAASEYLAWRDGQAASFSQFLLADTLTNETLALRARSGEPHALVAGTWTTGLLRENLAPKAGAVDVPLSGPRALDTGARGAVCGRPGKHASGRRAELDRCVGARAADAPSDLRAGAGELWPRRFPRCRRYKHRRERDLRGACSDAIDAAGRGALSLAGCARNLAELTSNTACEHPRKLRHRRSLPRQVPPEVDLRSAEPITVEGEHLGIDPCAAVGLDQLVGHDDLVARLDQALEREGLFPAGARPAALEIATAIEVDVERAGEAEIRGQHFLD